jgi:hypothetical protein
MHSSSGFESEIKPSNPIGEVICNKTTLHYALHSSHYFQTGDVMTLFSPTSIQDHPDRFTVQKNEKEHIVLNPEYLKYLNHSCTPNCFIDVDNYQLIALEVIEKGAELTFFYPSTEWEMAEPFECHCNTMHCLNKIQGAAHIALSDLKRYRVSSFIQEKIKTM